MSELGLASAQRCPLTLGKAKLYQPATAPCIQPSVLNWLRSAHIDSKIFVGVFGVLGVSPLSSKILVEYAEGTRNGHRDSRHRVWISRPLVPRSEKACVMRTNAAVCPGRS